VPSAGWLLLAQPTSDAAIIASRARPANKTLFVFISIPESCTPLKSTTKKLIFELALARNARSADDASARWIHPPLSAAPAFLPSAG